MKFGYFFLTVSIIFAGVLSLASVQDGTLKFQLASHIWSVDNDTAPPGPGMSHYFFKPDPSIDLSLSFASSTDFYRQIEKGYEDAMADIKRGKNFAQGLIDDHEIVFSKTSLKNEDSHRILTFQSESQIESQIYFTDEKYVIYPKQSLHLILRWRKQVNPSMLKRAQAEFEKIKVEIQKK